MSLVSLRVTSPSTTPIIDTPTVMQATRIDNTYDANLLTMYILVATEMAEKYLNRALQDQTYTYTFAKTHPPNGGYPWFTGYTPMASLNWNWTLLHHTRQALELPMSPIATVNTVVLGSWDQPDYALTLGTDYEQDLATDPSRIRLTPYSSNTLNWPTCVDHIQVNYTAGYGSSGQTIPQPIIQAVMMMSANLYENRGDDAEGEIMSKSVKALLNMYRLKSWW